MMVIGTAPMPKDAKLDRSFPLAHHAESSLRRSHGGRQSIKLGFQLSSPPLVEMRPIAAPLTSIIGEPDMPRLTPPSNLIDKNLPPLCTVQGCHSQSSESTQAAIPGAPFTRIDGVGRFADRHR